MKRIIFFAIIFIASSHFLAGQQTFDTLYLKNGSVVFGRIRENSENKFLIQTIDGFQFSFSPGEVDRFVSGIKYKKEMARPEGIGFTMQSGVLIGSAGEAWFALFSITPMITYTFNHIHSLSAGTGLEVYENLMLPLFAEYKINFTTKNVTPFYYLKAGGLFYLKSDEKGNYYNYDYKPGWTVGTGFGLTWPLSKYETYVQIGYRYSFVKKIMNYNNYDSYEEISNFHRLDISWGFKF
ncbi:MAG: hypothetical protein NT092_12400 [Bacteroidia bacterium]|nr:hypothetical protein [Bacteroidia bacterium]